MMESTEPIEDLPTQQVYIALEDSLLVPVCTSDTDTIIAPTQPVQSVSISDNTQLVKQSSSTSGVGSTGKHPVTSGSEFEDKKKLKTCKDSDLDYYLQGTNNENTTPKTKQNSDPKRTVGKMNSDGLFKMLEPSIANSLPKTHSPGYVYRHARATTESKTSTAKNPKYIVNVPKPKNINHFGDILKTRIGRYHYGLTLSDPPGQFFRGVIKGPTGDTQAVLFGDTELIGKMNKLPLTEFGHFVMDNTFTMIKNSTVGANHAITISLLYQSHVIPLWYAITSCSSTEVYKRIIIEFYQHVFDWPFLSVLLNDDPDLCRAVLAVFPDVKIYGSWYHYCCSVWNEMRRNEIHEECNKNPDLLSTLKMLFVIPYLPPSSEIDSVPTMAEGLKVVRKIAQEKYLPLGFKNVLDFVETFWFNTVGCKNWTVFGDQTRLINHIEISQLALLSFMRPDGTVWMLTRAFQKYAKSTHNEITKLLEGKPFFDRRKKCGKIFVKPIRNNMKKVLLGACDVTLFLESSSVYCEEILDVFLHPLYLSSTVSNDNHLHVQKWKIKINKKGPQLDRQ